MSSGVEISREITFDLRHGMESLALPHPAATLQPRLRSE